MSFTRNDLLKIYVPFVDVTGASNAWGPTRVRRCYRRESGLQKQVAECQAGASESSAVCRHDRSRIVDEFDAHLTADLQAMWRVTASLF